MATLAMRHLALVIMLGALAFSAGCVRSLSPFYSESDITFDESLSGTFIDGEQKMVVMVQPEPATSSYTIRVVDPDGRPAQLIARLAKLGDKTIMDLTVPQPDKQTDPRSAVEHAHLIPSHSMFVVHQMRPTLKLSPIDGKWLTDYLKANPDAIEHQIVQDDIVLTAPTSTLRPFIEKHLNTPEAWGETLELIPLRPTTPQPVP